MNIPPFSWCRGPAFFFRVFVSAADKSKAPHPLRCQHPPPPSPPVPRLRPPRPSVSLGRSALAAPRPARPEARGALRGCHRAGAARRAARRFLLSERRGPGRGARFFSTCSRRFGWERAGWRSFFSFFPDGEPVFFSLQKLVAFKEKPEGQVRQGGGIAAASRTGCVIMARVHEGGGDFFHLLWSASEGFHVKDGLELSWDLRVRRRANRAGRSSWTS